ncbi:hypothetical protein HDU98_000686 [Podochytrium sp. JEL0797]|nr:hypothetical protein HDU98_000686 [Podochytrium sp. JEL0797]
MSFLGKLFGSASSEAALSSASSSGRQPLMRFIGPRTPSVWASLSHDAPAWFALGAKTAHVPKSDNFFNAPPFPKPLGKEPAVFSPVPAAKAAPSTLPSPAFQTLSPNSKSPAAPSSILLYPSEADIPGSYRAKPMSAMEMEMIDLGGIYDAPKPAKKDGKKK